MKTVNYNTKYGKFILPENDRIILSEFRLGGHWGQKDIDFFLSIIDRDKNILEYGSHVGTHTIPYAKFINENRIVYSFEPQSDMYELLLKNIELNDIQNKIKCVKGCLFYYTGLAQMNSHFIDGDFLGSVEESKLVGHQCNYGGLTLGANGESTECFRMDDLNLENIGFIHSDAQGCDNIIFWGGRETIAKYKPIIFYEDSNFDSYNREMKSNIYVETIIKNYDVPESAVSFNVADFCIKELGYKTYSKGFSSYLLP